MCLGSLVGSSMTHTLETMGLQDRIVIVGSWPRLDHIQSAFLSIAPSDGHLLAEEPHYYTHCTEEKSKA